MNKEKINLLTIQLFLKYYKKDITERYAKCIDNIVLDNDILYTDERLWITTLEKHIELQQENKELHNKIDKAIEITHKILMNNADNRMICSKEEDEYFDWLDKEMLEQEKILKGDVDDN